MSTCFIADLHLSPEHPARTELFQRFLHEHLSEVHVLYILGDLFDAWVGNTPFVDSIASMLRELKARHIDVYFMPGNRDFLMDQDAVDRMGAHLVSDPCVIDLYGKQTLLKHGDDLCLDRLHLAFRRFTRYRGIQSLFLHCPLSVRQGIARAIRGMSRWHNPRPLPRSDISDALMKQAMEVKNAQQLIHGHTHQPSIHDFIHNKHWKRQVVLSDWHKFAHSLRCYPDGRQYLCYHR